MKLRITVEGKVYEVDVEVVGEEIGALPVAAPSAPAPAPHLASAPRSAPPPAPASSGGKGVFPSPLAGTVRAIKVRPGDVVAVDQEVVVLEAMKMETGVSASSAGTIKAIFVNVGDAVTAGQALLELE